MRPSPALLALLSATLVIAGCASSRPSPRVSFLGDGVFKSPTARDAEAYCRNFGAPLRYLDPKGVREPVGEVTYRCD